ncbi:MAG TPA: endonuclease [Bacilli bacterium]|nr:endonuclease [Bacilli bacterium]
MKKNKLGYLMVLSFLLAGCGTGGSSSSTSDTSTTTPTSVASSDDDHVIPSSEVTLLNPYQDPDAAAYYASIENFDSLEGDALKAALNTRINTGFHGVNYDQATTYIKQMDRVTEGGVNYVRGLYSRNLIPENNRQTNPYDVNQQVNFWNKEHCFPQSKLADGNDALKANNSVVNLSSNIANLFSEDNAVNEGRNNYSFTEIPDSIHNYIKDSFGNDTDLKFFTTGVQPTFLARGEVARANLYMILKYPENCGINENGYIGVFLKWNLEFPPTLERDYVRNSVVYDVQGDRNPFIDDNTLACRIWGNYDATTKKICGID